MQEWANLEPAARPLYINDHALVLINALWQHSTAYGA